MLSNLLEILLDELEDSFFCGNRFVSIFLLSKKCKFIKDLFPKSSRDNRLMDWPCFSLKEASKSGSNKVLLKLVLNDSKSSLKLYY